MNPIPRRAFLRFSTGLGLGATALGTSGVVQAIEPIARTGPARLRLSLAAYSFRAFFKTAGRGRKPGAGTPVTRQIDMFDFVDFCAEHGCEGTELTSYYFPQDVDDAWLTRLRAHVARRGLKVSGTAVGNNFTMGPGPERARQIADTKLWIDRAAVLGAPHIRVFAGSTKGLPLEEQRAHCIAAMEECCEYAGRKGILLGLENHGGIVSDADGLLAIVKAVKSPWCGVNLDTGNFRDSADPYAEIARCVPYSVNVQVKAEMRSRTPAAESPTDLARVVRILREGGYSGFVALEYESKEDPWVRVPTLLRDMKQLFGANA